MAYFFQIMPVSGQWNQSLNIPDTLIGPVFNLQIKSSVHQFFSGISTNTKAFQNQTVLGPTLIIRRGWAIQATVENQLTDTTTVHWHGLHVPAHADGGPHSKILPGAQWNAHFTCLDKAATYWYHPHFHGKTGEHTLQGAAGMILVRDAEESALSLPRRYGKDDFPLIIQSLEFGTDGQIKPRGFQDSIVLVNGGIKPFLQVPAQWVRFRLVNASNARNFNVGFSDNRVFQLIGNDAGLLGRPLNLTRIRLAPGERVELLIQFQGLEGQEIYLKSFASELPAGVQGGPLGELPPGTTPMTSPLNGRDFEILKLVVGPADGFAITQIPDSLAAQTPLEESQANQTRNIVFSSLLPGSWDGPFLVNDSIFNMDRIDFQVEVNQTEIWRIHNQTPLAHPFHLHGFPFYILDRYGGEPNPEEKGRKDVVLVHPNEQIRIIARFSDFADPTMPYMFHCHLLSHEDDGMMAQFTVVSPVRVKDELQEETVEIFPNPANDKVQIRCSKNGIWKIVNSVGVEILQGMGPEDINLAQWPKGMYMVISSGFSRKLIKN